MSATDELRRLLDERGVEWEGETDEDGWAFTRWHGFEDTGWLASSDELCGLLDLRGRFLFTPAQAIDATLGRGTCHAVFEVDAMSEDERVGEFVCSECGETFNAGHGEFPRYCPNCGRKVVE